MIIWTMFLTLIIVLLSLDLFVFHKDSESLTVKQAAFWTGFWILIAMLFIPVVYVLYESGYARHLMLTGSDLSGSEASMEFFAGYLVEKSLSIDNIFVMALIFSTYRVPRKYQYRILFWGILGAIIMRGIMILCGTIFIAKFAWTIEIFGLLLIFTALKLLFSKKEDIAPKKNRVLSLAQRIFRVTDSMDDGHFFVRLNGKLFATPLFLVLILIETTDVIFAVDSIPAIFGITKDPFIVFSSNIFAILGLRALYFVVSGAMANFKYMQKSIVALLLFVGVKMVIEHTIPISTVTSLIIIVSVIAFGLIASIISTARGRKVAIKLQADSTSSLEL